MLTWRDGVSLGTTPAGSVAGDEHHVVPLVAGSGDREDELFALNAAGEARWEQLDGRRSLAGVVATLIPGFAEAEDGAGERDVLGLVAALAAPHAGRRLSRGKARAASASALRVATRRRRRLLRAYPGRDVRAGRSWTERGGHETVPS